MKKSVRREVDESLLDISITRVVAGSEPKEIVVVHVGLQRTELP